MEYRNQMPFVEKKGYYCPNCHGCSMCNTKTLWNAVWASLHTNCRKPPYSEQHQYYKNICEYPRSLGRRQYSTCQTKPPTSGGLCLRTIIIILWFLLSSSPAITLTVDALHCCFREPAHNCQFHSNHVLLDLYSVRQTTMHVWSTWVVQSRTRWSVKERQLQTLGAHSSSSLEGHK